MIGTEAMVAQTTADLEAEAEALIERRRRVEAELTAPEVPGTPLDEAVRSRRRRADLEAELAVIDERLEPLRSELARVEAEAKAEQVAAQRQAAIDAGLAALVRVTAAREVLEAEITAFCEAALSTPRGRAGAPPELHFATRGEIEKIVFAARRLEGAA